MFVEEVVFGGSGKWNAFHGAAGACPFPSALYGKLLSIIRYKRLLTIRF